MNDFPHYSDPNGHGNGRNGTTGARQATLREFSAILFRRKWIVIGLFIVTTLTVLIITLSTPVVYISSGSVSVKRGERESVLTSGRRVLDEWEQALGTEVEIVKSEPVLALAGKILAADPEADGITIDPASVDVEVKGKTNVMAIGYVSGDPRVAERVCAAILRAYVEFRGRDFTNMYPRQFFEEEIGQVEADLARWTAMRRDFADQSGLIDVAEQNRQWIVQLSQLQGRRSEAMADLAEAQALRDQMLAFQKSPDVDLATFSSIFTNELSLVDLKRRILDQSARLATLRERYHEDAVEVVNTKKTLESLESILEREVAGRVEMSDSRTRQLKARIEVLDRDIQSIQQSLHTMPEKSTRLAQMDREIKTLEGRLRDLMDKQDQARVTENTTSSINVMLLESAGPARAANSSDPVRLALAPVFSIVVGIGLAFFIDGLDLTVRTSRHAEEAAELPVLATLTNRRKRSTPARS